MFIASNCHISIHSIPIILCREDLVYISVKMGEKLVGLRKIKDFEFMKAKRRDLGIWDFFDTFKKFQGLI